MISRWVGKIRQAGSHKLSSLRRHDEGTEIDAIAIAKSAMTEPSAIGLGRLAAAFDDIVSDELWRKIRRSTGEPFESFGEFATARAPEGLGIRCTAGAHLARQALSQNGHFGSWTEILERIARNPGRPRTLVNHEGFRFYTVSTTATSRDRLLLALRRHHPEQYKKVCSGQCSPHLAGIEAGLVVARKSQRLQFGACDIEAARGLSRKAQAKLLRRLFRSLHVDAQCTLLATEIEPRLGPDLARRWRAQDVRQNSESEGSSGS